METEKTTNVIKTLESVKNFLISYPIQRPIIYKSPFFAWRTFFIENLPVIYSLDIFSHFCRIKNFIFQEYVYNMNRINENDLITRAQIAFDPNITYLNTLDHKLLTIANYINVHTTTPINDYTEFEQKLLTLTLLESEINFDENEDDKNQPPQITLNNPIYDSLDKLNPNHCSNLFKFYLDNLLIGEVVFKQETNELNVEESIIRNCVLSSIVITVVFNVLFDSLFVNLRDLTEANLNSYKAIIQAQIAQIAQVNQPDKNILQQAGKIKVQVDQIDQLYKNRFYQTEKIYEKFDRFCDTLKEYEHIMNSPYLNSFFLKNREKINCLLIKNLSYAFPPYQDSDNFRVYATKIYHIITSYTSVSNINFYDYLLFFIEQAKVNYNNKYLASIPKCYTFPTFSYNNVNIPFNKIYELNYSSQYKSANDNYLTNTEGTAPTSQNILDNCILNIDSNRHIFEEPDINSNNSSILSILKTSFNNFFYTSECDYVYNYVNHINNEGNISKEEQSFTFRNLKNFFINEKKNKDQSKIVLFFILHNVHDRYCKCIYDSESKTLTFIIKHVHNNTEDPQEIFDKIQVFFKFIYDVEILKTETKRIPITFTCPESEISGIDIFNLTIFLLVNDIQGFTIPDSKSTNNILVHRNSLNKLNFHFQSLTYIPYLQHDTNKFFNSNILREIRFYFDHSILIHILNSRNLTTNVKKIQSIYLSYILPFLLPLSLTKNKHFVFSKEDYFKEEIKYEGLRVLLEEYEHIKRKEDKDSKNLPIKVEEKFEILPVTKDFKYTNTKFYSFYEDNNLPKVKLFFDEYDCKKTSSMSLPDVGKYLEYCTLGAISEKFYKNLINPIYNSNLEQLENEIELTRKNKLASLLKQPTGTQQSFPTPSAISQLSYNDDDQEDNNHYENNDNEQLNTPSIKTVDSEDLIKFVAKEYKLSGFEDEAIFDNFYVLSTTKDLTSTLLAAKIVDLNYGKQKIFVYKLYKFPPSKTFIPPKKAAKLTHQINYGFGEGKDEDISDNTISEFVEKIFVELNKKCKDNSNKVDGVLILFPVFTDHQNNPNFVKQTEKTIECLKTYANTIEVKKHIIIILQHPLIADFKLKDILLTKRQRKIETNNKEPELLTPIIPAGAIKQFTPNDQIKIKVSETGKKINKKKRSKIETPEIEVEKSDPFFNRYEFISNELKGKRLFISIEKYLKERDNQKKVNNWENYSLYCPLSNVQTFVPPYLTTQLLSVQLDTINNENLFCAGSYSKNMKNFIKESNILESDISYLNNFIKRRHTYYADAPRNHRLSYFKTKLKSSYLEIENFKKRDKGIIQNKRILLPVKKASQRLLNLDQATMINTRNSKYHICVLIYEIFQIIGSELDKFIIESITYAFYNIFDILINDPMSNDPEEINRFFNIYKPFFSKYLLDSLNTHMYQNQKNTFIYLLFQLISDHYIIKLVEGNQPFKLEKFTSVNMTRNIDFNNTNIFSTPRFTYQITPYEGPIKYNDSILKYYRDRFPKKGKTDITIQPPFMIKIMIFNPQDDPEFKDISPIQLVNVFFGDNPGCTSLDYTTNEKGKEVNKQLLTVTYKLTYNNNEKTKMGIEPNIESNIFPNIFLYYYGIFLTLDKFNKLMKIKEKESFTNSYQIIHQFTKNTCPNRKDLECEINLPYFYTQLRTYFFRFNSF